MSIQARRYRQLLNHWPPDVACPDPLFRLEFVEMAISRVLTTGGLKKAQGGGPGEKQK